MNHFDSDDLLSRYLDDEVTADERTRASAHLETCEACRWRFHELRQVRGFIKAAGDFELDPMFAYEVVRAVRRDEEGDVVWLGTERFARRLVLALSVFVICVVGLGSLFEPEQSVTVDRYLTSEPSDSLARRVLEPHQEISKDDIVYAALSK
ncbi:MAG TPA: hypothetical protein DCP63_06990 [Bacteroidetes bacterium]|nr:hypothetical protein [Bacteroidota bacterium]